MKLSAIVLVVGLAASSANAMDASVCPMKIRVTASGAKTINPENDAKIAEIVAKSDSQMSADLIKKVLTTVRKSPSLDIVLKLSKQKSNWCLYKNGTNVMTITETREGVIASLNTYSIDQNQSHSYSQWGNMVQIEKKVTRLGPARIGIEGGKAKMIMNILVQIPLGDYGTDGYDVPVQMGTFDKFDMSVVQ